jgi:hypothetical protein
MKKRLTELYFTVARRALFLIRQKIISNFQKYFQKTLDKQENYVIILKCIIIAFFFGGFLPFFQGRLVKKAQIVQLFFVDFALFAILRRGKSTKNENAI